MSRRAERDFGAGSLDLLLDTMCNTFGGVIFLAMLLAVVSESLPRLIRDRPPETSAPAVLDRRAEQARLEREKSRLEAALHQAAARPAPKPTAPSAAAELAALEARAEPAKRRLEALRRERAEERAEVERLEQERARRAAELEIAPPVEARTLRLPRLHDVTGKIPVFAALRNGRFYAISDLAGVPGFAPRFDETDVTVDRGPALWVVELKPGGGEPLDRSLEPGGKLADVLARTTPDRHFFSIMVYPDAYGAFQRVKTLLLGRGYDYIWAPADGAVNLVRVSTHDAL